MTELLDNTKEFWNGEWTSRFDHYQQDLRHAYYINAILNKGDKKILEIGAGSFRDFAKLNALGHNVFACDYSEKSIELAKNYFPQLEDKISLQNGFKTTFKDKEFDLTYHNGFWCYFEDSDVKLLAKEQKRITSKRAVFTLHNAHNKDFVDYFKRNPNNDKMFKIRFFEIDETRELLKGIFDEFEIIPVGKGKKTHEDYLINLDIASGENIKKCFDYHKMELLNISERLMCIATV